MKFIQIFSLIYLSLYQSSDAVRPAYEDDPERCPFTNRLSINGLPTEVTDKVPGMKYFRRTNNSRERLAFDQATSICKMYNLEPAEILDQDDYNEVINMVKETGWSYWIAVRGRYNPEFGNYNFDFKLADGQSKLGFQDFGPKAYDSDMTSMFVTFREGCVAVVPNNAHTIGVSWVKAPCMELNDILCQYKKSCYKRSHFISDPTRPVSPLEPMTLPEDAAPAYMISKNQATWPFAKQACEDAMMDLLWFDGKAEKAEFHKRFDKFMAGKKQYEGKSFWTAGRFSLQSPDSNIYDKLYLWRQNNVSYLHGFNTIDKYGRSDDELQIEWGIDAEAVHLGRSEPYDEGLSGIEKCLDAWFPENAVKFFTSKCEKAMRYFICKSPKNAQRLLTSDGMPKSSFVDYCVGDEYHKNSEKDCNGEMTFAGPTKPQCTCYSGVHAIMADIKCKPKLFVGSGCTQLKSKSSVHWKILPSMITKNNTWIVAVHSSDEKKEMFEWFAIKSEESAERQVLGETTFFFAGFDVYKRGSRELCFVKSRNASVDKFYEYHVSGTSAITLRYYMFDFKCNGKKVKWDKMKSHDVASEKNDCQLSGCSRTVETGRSGNETLDPSLVSRAEDIHSDDAAMAKKGGKAEGDVEDVNDNVNRQLLIYAVEMAFPHFTGPTDSMMTAPRNSWILLERIFELAKQTCYKIVKPDFLGRVLKYFKIAHFGENFDYDEYFSDTDTQQILSMLDVCQEQATRYREMDIEVDACTGQASMVRIEDNTKQIISRSSDDTGYQEVRHHHVMEVTWDVIDMWNAVCINEFKSSYLLYHRLETGLELLFNDKLRKLW
ncbi:unnamed protein product [Orchesella dallaii]|uniref:C-type lectin domain-containing protein n=1 Tax=Orchesella dallaii TaxID=48710 RepID=A0ABP1Q6C8_9HEXA